MAVGAGAATFFGISFPFSALVYFVFSIRKNAGQEIFGPKRMRGSGFGIAAEVETRVVGRLGFGRRSRAVSGLKVVGSGFEATS